MVHALVVAWLLLTTVIKMLEPGDEVISTNDLYGGSYRIFTTIFDKYGIKFHFVNMLNIKNIEEKINNNTKLIWVETPTNPMMNIIDVKSICNLARKKYYGWGRQYFCYSILAKPISFGSRYCDAFCNKIFRRTL